MGKQSGDGFNMKMKLMMPNFSVRHPWIIVGIVLVLTVLFARQFPKVKFDNDPENMLAEDEAIRVFHNAVKSKYSLYDFVIVGIVNERHPDGVFNVETLSRIHALTGELLSLTRGPDGRPVVTRAGTEVSLDLAPESAWRRALAAAFRHDANNLFDEQGHSAIIGRELIAPSVVDNIKQADLGALKLEYLMEHPPTTREEALVIRDDAMGNPLYSGTLVSEDEKAICLYIPIQKKTYSYNVAALVRTLTADWKGHDKVFITGQPVAQDTFGVEMLVQMATSAPLAGLAIFLLLLLFFRRISLIIAPMIVAVISVICTMGLLIGLGFDVHIMSSMIAIFLMPIAVADSVHILSEFFDLYHRFNDKAGTIRHVMQHLFRPMLYTSLTTIAGFASLAATPIPPVRIFGLHVAFGVALAWLLTMTLIPAYIMIGVPRRALEKIGHAPEGEQRKPGLLSRALAGLSSLGYVRWKVILGLTLGIIVLSAFGITRIRVNDNPVKWFTPSHPIRVADRVLNSHFGGTYTAYLTLRSKQQDEPEWTSIRSAMEQELDRRFDTRLPEGSGMFRESLAAINVGETGIAETFARLAEEAAKIDQQTTASWSLLADEINYLDPEGLTTERLSRSIQAMTKVPAEVRDLLLTRLSADSRLSGDPLLEKALEVCDSFTALSFREFVFEMQAELSAPLFKRPDVLRYVERLQAHLLANPVIGKTSSAVDALKKASFELQYTALPAASDAAAYRLGVDRNETHRSVPPTSAAVGQVYTQLEGMKKKDSLFHLVTRDYQEANIWVQLKSGDNTDMEAVVADAERFMNEQKAPIDLKPGWAGLTYLNVIWQDKMVRGMLTSLFSSFVVVMIMMIILFRSPLYGILSLIPLSVTIAFIYGLIGFAGKDYDMPVAILSALTLGLSVDFAIHFLERAREEQRKLGSWKAAGVEMFKEPAMAISRNAIIISVGFTPLLAAPLVPYKTVGFFLATIMAVSWLATLFILPALLTMLRRWAFKDGAKVSQRKR